MALFEALAWAGWWWVCARWPVVPSERMHRRVASASGRPGLPQRGAQRWPNSSSHRTRRRSSTWPWSSSRRRQRYLFAQKRARRQTENAGSSGSPIHSSWLQPRPTLSTEKCAAWAWRAETSITSTFIHTTRHQLARSARAAPSPALQPTFRGDWPPQSAMAAARRARTRTRDTNPGSARSHAGRLHGAQGARSVGLFRRTGRGKAPDMPVAGGCPARHAPYPRWHGWRLVLGETMRLLAADLIL